MRDGLSLEPRQSTHGRRPRRWPYRGDRSKVPSDQAEAAVVARRTILLGASAAVLAACSATTGTDGPRSAGSPSPSTTPTHRESTDAPWRQLQRNVTGQLWLPGSSGYDVARLVQNPRYDDNRPLAVLTVASAADVATALAFVSDHALPVAIRSGGHSYPGWSAGGAAGTGMPPSLVLDCRSLNQIDLEGNIATIGSGAALARVYDTLGGLGRAIPGGSCATVAVGGLTQGGGVGVLTRAMGLTCDAVLAMQVVTADGRVRTVDSDNDPDLFWALRGGGGGHVGVVTAYTFQTQAVPTIATFYMTWPWSDAVEVLTAWQQWAPKADPRLWSTLKALGGRSHDTGPTLQLAGTWVGGANDLDGQLAGLLDDVPVPNRRSGRVLDYRTAMAAYAGCADIPANQCHTGPGGALHRESFAATSHVGYSALPSDGITALLDHVEDAQRSNLIEAGASLDALGGKVRNLGPSDTAFVHRHALMTVQYTATYAGQDADSATGFVRALRTALDPFWGNHAYVNYADRSISDYRTAYSGENAGRLAATKRRYDPHDLFRQPQGW